MIILEEIRVLSLLLSISLIRLESNIVQVVRMGRISIPTGGLIVLGVLLIILAGFNNGNVPPSGYWGLYGQYFLLIGGSMLIVLAVALILRERK